MHDGTTIDLPDDEVKIISQNSGAVVGNGLKGGLSTIKEAALPGLAALDRKQMEAERLARLRASKLPENHALDITGSNVAKNCVENIIASNHDTSRTSKRRKLHREPDTTALQDDIVSGAKSSISGATSNHDVAKSSDVRVTEVNNLSSPIHVTNLASVQGSLAQIPKRSNKISDLEYPLGVVKRTWAFKHDRGNDIKIEEVLQKNTLNIAVMSSFQWNWEWVTSKLNSSTKIIMIMQAKDQAMQEQYRSETKGLGNLRLCFPPMPGQVSCMHSKLMLLFHSTYLRIVVPTANLVPYDWGESPRAGIMENTVFLIDLPRLSQGPRRKEDLSQFGKGLFQFLEAMKLPEDACNGVLSFDFSNTRSLAFVHSIGGTHFNLEMRETGYLGLNKAVRDLNLRTNKSLELDLVSASIGSLNEKFIGTLYLAAQGADSLETNAQTTLSKLKGKVRIFFPAHNTVQASTGGADGAGTICLQKRWWEAVTFPSQLFHDHRSVRRGLLSHSKIIFARGVSAMNREEDQKPIAWAYVGSANLSESAWGKMVADRSRKETKFICRNWECGVLIPLSDERIAKETKAYEADERGPGDLDDIHESSEAEVPKMTVFGGVVDVPMEWPAEEIGNRQPWYFMGP